MAYVGTPIDTTNQFQSLQGKRFSGDGSTTAFTLDIAPSSVFDIEVFVENVRQDPNSAYGISGTTLTFTGAPPSGTNNIYVVHQAKAVGTIDVPASSVVPASLASNIISGQTALTSAPDDTDELLISDAGTIKRIDVSLIGGKNTPAFFGKKASGQGSISRATFTKVTGFTNTEIDTDTAFDGTTFTVPSDGAGKYYIFLQLYADYGTSAGSDGEYSIASIYVNGSSVSNGLIELQGSANYIQTSVFAHVMVDLSASDTVEAYVYLKDENGGTADVAAGVASQFGGYKLIGV